MIFKAEKRVNIVNRSLIHDTVPIWNKKEAIHSVVVVTTESQYIGFWIGGPLTLEILMTQDDLERLETN